ncbi:hypothetical protein MAM1_0056c03624 [Mucor ambiguus]|uniref:Uncharacterized protein n=1 Tax=Mucor ambiguus TaxID=91626 RepID=A0A0C9M9X6_9FUNG|nr:hypothetical protein MAM1_0056c03624 [Mucor ambiguus]
MPKDENHIASFANVLAAVLSLRRLVYLNYGKLNTILVAKYAHQSDTTHFSIDNESNFRFDSTEGLQQEILATDGDEFNDAVVGESSISSDTASLQTNNIHYTPICE